MLNLESVAQFLKDLWRAMLDHWIVTLLILIFVFNVASPPVLVAFGIFKLVDKTREDHRNDN